MMSKKKCKIKDCGGGLVMMENMTNGVLRMWYQCEKCQAKFEAITAVGDRIIEKKEVNNDADM